MITYERCLDEGQNLMTSKDFYRPSFSNLTQVDKGVGGTRCKRHIVAPINVKCWAYIHNFDQLLYTYERTSFKLMFH